MSEGQVSFEPPINRSPDRPTGGSSGRSFEEIRQDINHLVSNPNAAREQDIRMERQRLVNEAKEVGLFVSLKNQMIDIQNTYDFNTAGQKISDIDINRLEQEARGLLGWSDRMEGLLGEYKEVALMNMELALLRAGGRGDERRARLLERHIDLRGWGMAPAGLELQALRYLDSQVQTVQPGPQAGIEASVQQMANLVTQLLNNQQALTPESFARALGVATPEQQMELYRKAFYYKSSVGITIGQEPKFFPFVSEAEQNQWRAQAELSTVCANKKGTTRVDYLMPDDQHSEIMELSKDTLSTLFGDENGEGGKLGVMEAASLYTVIYHEDVPLSRLLTPPRPSRNMNPDQRRVHDELLHEYNTLRNIINDSKRPGTINSIWEIKDGPKHSALRRLISYWLSVSRGLTTLEVYEAEVNGDNWKYICNLVEDKDIEGKLPPKTDMKHLPTWMVNHLQMRYVKKIRGNDEWGTLGTWGEYAKRASGNDNYFRDYDRGRGVLPNRVLPNAMEKIEIGKYEDGRPKNLKLRGIREFVDKNIIDTDKGNIYMYDLFLENGRRLLANPGIDRRRLLSMPWVEVSEGPFADYYSNSITPAILVFNVAVKGPETAKDISYAALGNACRKLDIHPFWRARLKLVKYGIKQDSTSLVPYNGWVSYGYFESGLKKIAPNFDY